MIDHQSTIRPGLYLLSRSVWMNVIDNRIKKVLVNSGSIVIVISVRDGSTRHSQIVSVFVDNISLERVYYYRSSSDPLVMIE